MITLDSRLPSPVDFDYLHFSLGIGKILEEFARDFSSPENYSEASTDIRESENDDSLEYFLTQFLLLDLPIPEGTFYIGPNLVDLQELCEFLTFASPNTLVSWFLRSSR